MAIYGTALLSICLLAGLFIGQAAGAWLGIGKDLGGVGIAMLLLIVASDRLRRAGRLSDATAGGIRFWSAIYIPIVVAMAASLNVRGALHSGAAAFLAGGLAVAVCFALVPIIARTGKS